jgi:hypothetical protein
METLEFSYNWNMKLSCNCFTTIRLHNPARYVEGNVFKVTLNSQIFGIYRVASVKTIQLSQINDWMAYMDTGYDAAKTRDIFRDMYKNKKIDVETARFDYILLVRAN